MILGRTFVCVLQKPPRVMNLFSRPILAGSPYTPLQLGTETQIYSGPIGTPEGRREYLDLIGFDGGDRRIQQVSEVVRLTGSTSDTILAVEVTSIYMN